MAVDVVKKQHSQLPMNIITPAGAGVKGGGAGGAYLVNGAGGWGWGWPLRM